VFGCQRPEALEQAERSLPRSFQLDHPFAGFGGDCLTSFDRRIDPRRARARASSRPCS